MHRRARPLAVIATAGLLVSACGGGDAAPSAAPTEPPVTSSPAPDAPATSPALAATTPSASGTAAPAAAATAAPATEAAVSAPEALQFTAPLVGGGEIDLAAGYGGQPVLFWFWAPY